MDYKGQLYSGELDFKLLGAEEKNMYLRELEKKLHYVNYYDSLTKLYNKDKIHIKFKNLQKNNFWDIILHFSL